MLCARDSIEKINGKNPISYIVINYHFCNFVIYTKAYLDAIAVTLNNFYNLGYVGGICSSRITMFIGKLTKGTFDASAQTAHTNLPPDIRARNIWLKVVLKKESLAYKLHSSIKAI